MAASTEVRARDSLRRVVANRNLRRVQLAFFGSLTGDWAYATAITVWAYTEGGAAAVGAFQAARFVGMAVAGPLGAVVADRVPRRTFMLVTDLIRALLVGVAATSVMTDGPAVIVYVLGVVTAMVGAPFRSAQAGLIPKLVSTPDELTASNAVAANLENIVMFAGPALGAILVGTGSIELVMWLNVATYVWSFLLVAGVRPLDAVLTAGPLTGDTAPDDDADEGTDADEGLAREVVAGFAVVAKDGDLRTVSLLAAAQGLIWGALTVFMVIIAVEMLDSGPEGVGYLNAIMGVTTIAGGVVVLGRVGKGRLAQDMTVGVLGWSLPLCALALFPSPVTAVAALALIGLADPWVNVGFETIPQRIASDRVISRVYAAVESALIAAMALGSLLAPLMVRVIGFEESMALLGAVVTLYALSAIPRMRRLDARLTEPVALPLLRSIPLFAPLSPPTLETLARKSEPLSFASGEAIVREGEASDRFYVIASGSVDVTQAGRLLRTETAGDFFGEIGLLRDVPRTATVTAATETVVHALGRGDFVAAVSGVREARAAAEEVIAHRLAV